MIDKNDHQGLFDAITAKPFFHLQATREELRFEYFEELPLFNCDVRFSIGNSIPENLVKDILGDAILGLTSLSVIDWVRFWAHFHHKKVEYQRVKNEMGEIWNIYIGAK